MLHLAIGSRTYRIVLCAVVLVAAVIRLTVGYVSYPVSADAPHFVQHGIAMARGHHGSHSERWSQIPMFTAAAATYVGLDPKRAVQALTLVAGILAVPLFCRLVSMWTGIGLAGLIAGAWMATSPQMIQFSVNSMGEMPFLCLLLVALSCIPGPLLHPALTWKSMTVASLAIGIGLGFRPPESVISMAFLTTQLGIAALFRRNWRLLGIVLSGVLVFLCCAAPLVWATKAQTGLVSASSKVDNLAYGVGGYDSKVIYGWGRMDGKNPMYKRIEELKQVGPAVFLWRHRAEVARRWLSNMMIAVRHTKGMVFPGAFSMGTGWYVMVLFISAAWVGMRRGWAVLFRMGSWALAMPVLMSLSFVHPRWLTPWYPFLIALLATVLAYCVSVIRFRRTILSLIACAFIWQGWVGAEDVADTWVLWNTSSVARELRKLDPGEAIVSSVNPVFAIEYYQDNPLQWKNQPYGEISDVIDFADRQGVQYLVIQSAAYPHWPIHQLRAENAVMPDGWEVVMRRDFSRVHPRWGEQTDRYLIIGRAADHAPELRGTQ